MCFPSAPPSELGKGRSGSIRFAAFDGSWTGGELRRFTACNVQELYVHPLHNHLVRLKGLIVGSCNGVCIT